MTTPHLDHSEEAVREAQMRLLWTLCSNLDPAEKLHELCNVAPQEGAGAQVGCSLLAALAEKLRDHDDLALQLIHLITFHFGDEILEVLDGSL